MYVHTSVLYHLHTKLGNEENFNNFCVLLFLSCSCAFPFQPTCNIAIVIYVCMYPLCVHTYLTYIPYIHTYCTCIHTIHTYHTCIHTVHTYIPYIHTYCTYIHTVHTYVHTYILYIHTYHTYIHTVHTYILHIHMYIPYIRTYILYILHMYCASFTYSIDVCILWTCAYNLCTSTRENKNGMPIEAGVCM